MDARKPVTHVAIPAMLIGPSVVIAMQRDAAALRLQRSIAKRNARIRTINTGARVLDAKRAELSRLRALDAIESGRR